MAGKAFKALVLLGLVAFAAAARVQDELAIPGQLQLQDAAAGAEGGELMSHSGRSLKTLWLFSWWKCYFYRHIGNSLCAATGVFFDLTHFGRLLDWKIPNNEQQRCGIDRHEACSCHAHRCGQNLFFESRSWDRYWCPGTCRHTHYPADYFPSHMCGQYRHLCNIYDHGCYHWNSLPYSYWCQNTCGGPQWGKK